MSQKKSARRTSGLQVAALAAAVALPVVGLGGATSALAQTQTGSEPRARAGAIEEIVVTSRRRAESAQDVPVSVTAFRQEDIDRIQPRTIRDLDGLAPNLFIGMNTAGPGAGAIFIRGLGYADIEKTQSPAVAIILDGVYQGTSTGQLIDAFDIEQVEINRGPQGVLYGKNTTGGTIVVQRTRPTGEFGIRTSVQLGTDNERVFKAVANAPLIEDELALKIGGTYKERDGFYRNTTRDTKVGDIDYWSLTTSLLWTPNDSFEAQFTYDRIQDDSDTPPQDPRYNGDTPFVNEADLDEFMDMTVDSFGLQMTLDTDIGLVTSITGFSKMTDDVLQDFDGSTRATPARPLVQLHTLREQSYKQFTQELRLDMDLSEQLLFSFGGFYLKSEQGFAQNTDQVVQIENPVAGIGLPCAAIGFSANPNPDLGDQFCQIGPLISDQLGTHDVRSIGLFGNLTYMATENLELTLGARYIDEKKRFANQFVDRTAGRTGPLVRDSDSWDDVIIAASANWQVTNDNLVYISYSEGFRSGGFSIRGTGQVTCPLCPADFPGIIGVGSAGDPVIAAPLTFDPEDVWSVEIGSKNDFLDGRLRLNLAAFHTELKGQQLSSIITTPGIIPGTNTLINNADKTVIRGLEVEATAVLHEHFSLVFAGGLQDAERRTFEIDGTRVPIGPDGQVGAPGPFTIPKEQVGRSPDWNWALSGIYSQQVGAGFLDANLTVRGQDDFVLVNSITGVPVFEKGYTLMDASVAYSWSTEAGNNFRVALFGKNLTDKKYREQSLPLGPFGGFQGWGPPRTAAVEFQMEF
jgi:iron complex outermembrane receptor protein